MDIINNRAHASNNVVVLFIIPDFNFTNPYSFLKIISQTEELNKDKMKKP